MTVLSKPSQYFPINDHVVFSGDVDLRENSVDSLGNMHYVKRRLMLILDMKWMAKKN